MRYDMHTILSPGRNKENDSINDITHEFYIPTMVDTWLNVHVSQGVKASTIRKKIYKKKKLMPLSLLQHQTKKLCKHSP